MGEELLPTKENNDAYPNGDIYLFKVILYIDNE